jgi:uncharacterized membrane protein
MSRIGSAGDAPQARQQKTAGSWAGYLIFALFLLFLIVYDAQTAYRHQWASFTGIAVFTLAMVAVPTGGAKWVLRSLRHRKRPTG